MANPDRSDLTKLAANVQVAQVAFEEAEAAESVARNDRSSALNRLNAAQKAFDAAFNALRKAAPRESDWRADERRGMAIPG